MFVQKTILMKRTNLLLLFILTFVVNSSAQNLIHVKLAPNLKGPFTGRLMVYTQADTSKPFGQAPEGPAFAIEVKDWKGEEVKVLDSKSIFLTKTLDSVPAGHHKFVAILDTNTKERGNSAFGNLYTRKEEVALLGGKPNNPVQLTLTHIFPTRKFNESDSVKEVVLRSTILSKTRKEAIFLKAGVVLPPSYLKDPKRVFPVVYVIPGWGGTHHHAYNKGQRNAYGVGQGQEKIYVFLNPETQTPYGLHAFVDSRVNGPWGTALVTELMPYISKTFRASALAKETFLTGQSSGGYGAIWLALHFPKRIGGCWATSPDPIDFSNFTGVNIYQDENFYKDSAGKERGLFFVNGKPTSTIRQMTKKELLEGDGGQQQSFEAEFGLPDKNKRPQQLFDPNTGQINKKVASSWKTYDLAEYVLANWRNIKNDASNKIKIYVGENDNFLLQRSALAFQDKIKAVNAAIDVEVIKGADHFSARNPALTKQIQAEIDQRLASTIN